MFFLQEKNGNILVGGQKTNIFPVFSFEGFPYRKVKNFPINNSNLDASVPWHRDNFVVV